MSERGCVEAKIKLMTDRQTTTFSLTPCNSPHSPSAAMSLFGLIDEEQQKTYRTRWSYPRGNKIWATQLT